MTAALTLSAADATAPVSGSRLRECDAVSSGADTTLGEIIRRQRELQEVSMRQFARMVGISNPYLSQIERGLRDPSEQVLRGIAESLETTVDVLYAQAGLATDDDGEEDPPALAAIRADPALTARQRQALVEVYEAFTGRHSRRRRRAR
jgi:transcriptional regulator with XRE-family HTH domain